MTMSAGSWGVERGLVVLAVMLWLAAGPGCAVGPSKLTMTDTQDRHAAGTILSGADGQSLTWEALVEDLTAARIVYVGENHTNPEHHVIQARLIREVARRHPDLMVGLEMFDHRYDPVLARWSAGALEREAFVAESHWYARCGGWQFDFDLYAPVFEVIRELGLTAVGLNAPFHLPPKISAAGLASLLPDERRLLPEAIDLGDADHRAYVEQTFRQHPFRRPTDFDRFYEAQCTWEDTMAEAVSRKIGVRHMLVLCGNGHIVRKFGIPNRAFRRNGMDFRTVFLAPVGTSAEGRDADYIWATP
jgi:uncharacterized iron-regulated protein